MLLMKNWRSKLKLIQCFDNMDYIRLFKGNSLVNGLLFFSEKIKLIKSQKTLQNILILIDWGYIFVI